MKLSTAILAATLLTGFDTAYGAPEERMRSNRSEKMDLTPEESTKLSALSGKEKKQYIKQLKEKYKK
jgi:hypothetical protein